MRSLAACFAALILLTACNLPLDSGGLLPDPEIFAATSPPSATPSISPTPTITPTPTPIPPHELTIEYLRQQNYPGSELVIEQTMASGDNYYQYIASYYSEGLKQYGLLTIPFGERPATGWPVIIFNHGYIEPDVYRSTERYVAYVAGFARSGYIVFRPDYRGHDQSEGIARGAYRNPDYVIDVLNAVASLRAYPDADPERIGMWGHSMGGYIAVRAMVVDPSIKAGVIWAGVVASYEDMYYTGERPRYGSRTIGEIYGPPEADPQFWSSISANSYLADLSGPLQLHHGTGDSSVAPSFSSLLTEEARAAGQICELYFYEGDDHNITDYFWSAMTRSIEFFDLHVKGSS